MTRPSSLFYSVVVVVCGLYLAVTPLLNGWTPIDLYDLKRLIQIGLLAGVSVSVVTITTARTSLLTTVQALSRPVRISLIVLVIAGLLSASQAADPSHAFLEVSHLLLLAVVSMVIAAGVAQDSAKVGKLIGWVLFSAALVYSVWFARDYIFSQLDLAYSFRRGQINALWPNGEFLGYAHPRFLNQVQTILLPLLVLPVLWTERTAKPVCYLLMLVAATWWTMALASGARGTLLCSGVAFVITSVVYLKSAKRYYLLNVIALAAGIALFFILFQIFGDTAESIDKREIATSSERINLWKHALGLFVSEPLLGVGPMHFAKYHYTWGVHPHNLGLQFLAEWGVVGVAALVVVGSAALMGLWKTAQGFSSDVDVDATVRSAVATAVIAGFGHSLLSGVAVMPAGQIALVVICGWAVGQRLGQREAHPPSERVRSATSRITTIVLAALMVVSTTTEVYLARRSFEKREVRRESAVRGAVGHHNLPRFWLWGCLNEYEPKVPHRDPNE